MIAQIKLYTFSPEESVPGLEDVHLAQHRHLEKQQQATAQSLEPVKARKPVQAQQVKARAMPMSLLASRPFIATKASLCPSKLEVGERHGSPVAVPQDEEVRWQMTEIVGSK